MVTRWVKVLIAAVVMVVSLGGGVLAQDDRAPELVIFYENDVWTLSGDADSDPQPHPFCGTGYSDERRWSPLIVSPDGAHLAYLTMPENEGFNGPIPTNVRLCHGDLQADILITPQPENWELGASDPDFAYNAQSLPAWSPDSQWLAWTTLYNPAGDDTLALFAYNVVTGELYTVTRDFPQQFGIPTPLDVVWVPEGIVVLEDVFAERTLGLYSVAGERLDRFPLPAGDDRRRVDDIFRVRAVSRDVIAVVYGSGVIDLVNPATGRWRELVEGYLQLSVPGLRASESLSVNYDPAAEDGRVWVIETLEWIALDYNGSRNDFSIAITPDGQAVAYGGEYQLFVWRAGEMTTPVFPGAGDVMRPNISVVGAPPAWGIVSRSPYFP